MRRKVDYRVEGNNGGFANDDEDAEVKAACWWRFREVRLASMIEVIPAILAHLFPKREIELQQPVQSANPTLTTLTSAADQTWHPTPPTLPFSSSDPNFFPHDANLHSNSHPLLLPHSIYAHVQFPPSVSFAKSKADRHVTGEDERSEAKTARANGCE